MPSSFLESLLSSLHACDRPEKELSIFLQVIDEADQGSSGRVSSGGEGDPGQAEGGPRFQVLPFPGLRNPLPGRRAVPAAAAAAADGQL